MITQIRKRDGRIVGFKSEKITWAIFKAANAVGGNNWDMAAALTDEVMELAAKRFDSGLADVESIQDLVEKILIENGHARTAKAYILYREKRRSARESNALIGATINMFSDYLGDKDWQVQENANTQRSINGMNNYVRETFTKQYWLHEVYPEEVREAHLHGEIHMHDLGFFGPYCAGWDLRQLLMDGFGGVPGKVESSAAKHLRSFLGQVVNSTFTTQGETAGAQAWSSFDTYCAPFIRYDSLTFKQVKQALQEFIFNINVPTRVGFQCPFSNLTFDIVPPSTLRNEPVIIGGQYTDDVYGDFQKEMDIFNLAFCEVMLEGDSKGRVFTFPIPTINVTNDFAWDSPVVNKFMEITCKYGIPYFSNYINSDLSHLHAQVQQTFISNIWQVISGAAEASANEALVPQFVVSTHSSHILDAVDFEKVRYFERCELEGEDREAVSTLNASQVHSLRNFQPKPVTVDGTEIDPEEAKRFLLRYLKLTHCDLFFADAAILVEGTVERLLLPKMVEKSAPSLRSRYLSILEVGGAYAHRFEGLLSFLDIPYLVITDLDSVDPAGNHPACRGDNPGALTSNASLKQLFGANTVAQLLALAPDQKVHAALDRCVAFQTGITVEEDGSTLMMVPRTFEEAFVYDNFALLRSGEVNVVTDLPENLENAYQAIFEGVRSSGFKKTDFALGVLSCEQDWATPGYIAEGLHWLEQRLADAQGAQPLAES